MVEPITKLSSFSEALYHHINYLVTSVVSRSEPLMPFATVAGFGSAATILAAHVSSNVGGPGQLMCIRHYAVAVKPQMTSYT